MINISGNESTANICIRTSVSVCVCVDEMINEIMFKERGKRVQNKMKSIYVLCLEYSNSHSKIPHLPRHHVESIVIMRYKYNIKSFSIPLKKKMLCVGSISQSNVSSVPLEQNRLRKIFLIISPYILRGYFGVFFILWSSQRNGLEYLMEKDESC